MQYSCLLESSCIRCRVHVQWLSSVDNLSRHSCLRWEGWWEWEWCHDNLRPGYVKICLFLSLISNFQFICVLSDHKWHSLGQLLPGISEGRRGDGTQWQTTEGGRDKSEKYAHRISGSSLLCLLSYLSIKPSQGAYNGTYIDRFVLFEYLPVQVVDLR